MNINLDIFLNNFVFDENYLKIRRYVNRNPAMTKMIETRLRMDAISDVESLPTNTFLKSRLMTTKYLNIFMRQKSISFKKRQDVSDVSCTAKYDFSSLKLLEKPGVF